MRLMKVENEYNLHYRFKRKVSYNRSSKLHLVEAHLVDPNIEMPLHTSRTKLTNSYISRPTICAY